MKNLVYKEEIGNENILRKIIINKYEGIKNKSRLMRKIKKKFMKRILLRVDEERKHFETI